MLLQQTDNMAALLDFDLSGQPGKTYPPGFNQGIPDGVRHSDAVSGRPMQFAHDVFSLIAMLKSLKLSNKTHNAEYQALLKSSNSLEAIHAELLELNQALKFTVSVRDQSRPAPHVGSGSPATVNAQPPPPDSSGTSSDAAPQVWHCLLKLMPVSTFNVYFVMLMLELNCYFSLEILV
jgi:hypothetical protein